MNRPRFSHQQRMTISAGILAIVMLVVILQLWLFMATMEAYLGGDWSVALPAFLASLVCLALNLGLFHYLCNLER